MKFQATGSTTAQKTICSTALPIAQIQIPGLQHCWLSTSKPRARWLPIWRERMCAALMVEKSHLLLVWGVFMEKATSSTEAHILPFLLPWCWGSCFPAQHGSALSERPRLALPHHPHCHAAPQGSVFLSLSSTIFHHPDPSAHPGVPEWSS